jgi:Flp pilus assembly protein TadD
MKPARPATARALAAGVLGAAAALVLAVQPASAGLFGGGKKPEAAKPAAPAEPQPAAPQPATAEQRAAAERQDPLTRAAFWGREMQIDPTDIVAGVRMSAALRALGRNEEAVAVAQQVLAGHPDNVEALLEDARAKIAGGAPFYAIASLKAAQAAAPKDWRPLSLLGVALEQTERPDEAREAYIAGLKLSPENPSILTNYALFHAARGDKAQAETLLRRAVAGPGAGARERQNLALVLGLQGKLAEAERLMRQDLPPAKAAANLAYLRASPAPIASAQRNWDQMGAQ